MKRSSRAKLKKWRNLCILGGIICYFVFPLGGILVVGIYIGMRIAYDAIKENEADPNTN